MRIYFGTNRDPDNIKHPTGFGTHVSRHGLTDLRFGWADFADDDRDSYTLHVAPEKLKIDPAKAATGDFSDQVLGSREVFEAIRKSMVDHTCDCVVYIHGFDDSFDDAIKRTAQLKSFYGDRPMVWVVFSWPSNGSLTPFKAYASDREDAHVSGVALGRGLLKLSDFLHHTPPRRYCRQHLHIVAHSMGVYALRWAVQILRERDPDFHRLFDQVLLFGADVDADAFAKKDKLAILPRLARRVSCYINPDDDALLLSDVTKGNPERLGADGPRHTRTLPDKIDVIDVQPVIDAFEDPNGHQYYRMNPQVRSDVLAVFADTPSDLIKTRRYVAERHIYRMLTAKAERAAEADDPDKA